jgi:serine/threonine protein kinase
MFASQQVYTWSLNILSALHHLHDRDPVIIHRDLKPSNILVARDRSSLKLTDFGLSRSVDRAALDSPDPSPASCKLSGRLGTLRYSAPEVFARDEKRGGVFYTDRADIFSAALIIHWLLTHRKPRGREDPRERPDLVPARKRWPALAELLERMWAHVPEERPSAGDCVVAVQGMPLKTDCTGKVSAGEGGCLTQ